MRRVTSVRKARSYVKAVKAVFNLAPACSSEKPRLSPEDPPTPHLKVVQMSINESRQGRYKSYVILAEIMHFHEHSRPRNSQRRFALRHPILFFFFFLLITLRSTMTSLSFPFRTNGNELLFIFLCTFRYDRIPIDFIATRDSTRASSSLLRFGLLTVADSRSQSEMRVATSRYR